MLTWSIPSGTSIGVHLLSVRILPATFFKEWLNKARVSGVSYADRRMLWRRYAALPKFIGLVRCGFVYCVIGTYCPSRYHGLMREKSTSCDSLGIWFKLFNTNCCGHAYRLDVPQWLQSTQATWTCSQFCMVRASIWSMMSTSIDERKSAFLQ